MKHQYILVVFLFLILSQYSIAQKSEKKFGRNEIIEDLEYLNNSLKDAHYNLYAYTSEKDFSENYQNVKQSIAKDSVTLLQATTIFQKVISGVNNGHTEIDFPGASYRTYAYSGGTLFPLEIAVENNKSLIRKNFSDNPDIKIGSEIISINGILMKDILSEIYPQVSAERTYFKNAKIEMISFPRLYWQVFGKQDNFQIKIRSNGAIKKYSIKAVKLIEGYEMKRTEVLNSKMEITFFDKSACINPGNFSGDEHKYQSFIDSAFVEINKRKSKNLIIDLRNNAGGNDSFSDYLVSYFADKPFKWNSEFTLKTSKFLKEHTRKYNDTTNTYFEKILNHKDGEIYNFEFDEYQPQPKLKRFNGEVYVLVNRQSHSQSAVTASQIQDYKFGTIVGEETGDFPTLYASQFQYTLPNTGIVVKVSKGQIVRVNGSKKPEGVIPDIMIKDHLLDEEDEILNGLLKKLN
ncbi:S41 family peptidase [Tenacibaculum tangerinum]|uniref:S41 family peptidase n=1 Tax=Tenacibaculum tangerinum TaxID=3038772 RepID=A0ABY8L2P1_9FLAO|nr:S41 family peptidase [Tenacibaculum tangerinum]WGH75640.1 S41 family peptidase [Tenacibaculum tangerinum]